MKDAIAMRVESLHHVSLPVTDLERSRRFYRDVLGLAEIERPPFDFPGAWFGLGSHGQLHLIAWSRGPSSSTYRKDKGVDSRDIHLALRVASFGEALRALQASGYSDDASDELLRMKVSPNSTAGFPQIYILDPDRHVIEINASRLDVD